MREPMEINKKFARDLLAIIDSYVDELLRTKTTGFDAIRTARALEHERFEFLTAYAITPKSISEEVASIVQDRINKREL